MSAFATVERRRREELLAIQKQDRDQQQAQTTDEPVVPSPPEQQDSSAEQQDPPLHLFIEPALLPAQTELSPRPEESWAFGPPKVMKNGSCSATTVDGGTALPFVISTEAQPNFLLRDAGDDHVWLSAKRAACRPSKATGLDRKFGGAQRRDLRFSGPLLGMFFDRAYPDLRLRRTSNRHVRGSP